MPHVLAICRLGEDHREAMLLCSDAILPACAPAIFRRKRRVEHPRLANKFACDQHRGAVTVSNPSVTGYGRVIGGSLDSARRMLKCEAPVVTRRDDPRPGFLPRG